MKETTDAHTQVGGASDDANDIVETDEELLNLAS